MSGAALTFLLVQLRSESLDSGGRLLRSFTLLAAEQTARTISSVDEALRQAERRVQGQLRGNADTEVQVRTALRGLLERRPYLRAIWVLDRDGRIVFDTDTGNIGLDLSDRPYFKLHRDLAAIELEVGAPVRSRTMGDWFISATRTLYQEQGRFDGIVVAAFEPHYLDKVWRSDEANPISITLLSTDGTLLMRSPFVEAAMGKSFATHAVFGTLVAQHANGMFHGPGIIDANRWISTYRILPEFPKLLVMVGQPVDSILRDWTNHLLVVVTGWILASGLLAALGVRLTQEWRQRRMAEARYQRLFDASPFPMWVFDFDTLRFLDVNQAGIDGYGWSREEVMGMTLSDIRPAEDLARMQAELADPKARTVRGMRHRRKDGSLIDVEVTLRTVEIAGRRSGLSLARNVTEEVRLERLHRAAEQQLRQAQKMEAIGQLTGGIAHDFNNMLTVIIANVEALMVQLPDGSPLRTMAERILRAAEGSSDLTRRLLAFARQQPLQPKPIVINEFVVGMEQLLRRALGETIDIRLTLGRDIWSVMIDPAQLESAILNLSINARDAMPKGGTLTIETANVRFDAQDSAEKGNRRRGDYVMVAVSDTGSGVDPELLDRIFEPFFTTKEVGKGTGLGLPMVHGFVTQSYGHVDVSSKIGSGTCFKLYFPRVVEGSSTDLTPTRLRLPDAACGERILVVEDNEQVRATVVTQLQQLGYRVRTAENAAAALEIIRSPEDIDLLFTDVVMPGGMSGHELAEKARLVRPDMAILYTSGYIASAIPPDDQSATSINLLNKPYRLHELGAKLREVLDARR